MNPIHPPRVTIRMYCQGLGDCFLLRFESEPGNYYHVLIDCGIYKASPDAGKIMNQVVDSIMETTQNHLDLLICTHEHWDHISGFDQAYEKFNQMTIDRIWQAWTEDPKDKIANRLRKTYEGDKRKLTDALHRVKALNMNREATLSVFEAFSVMNFFGVSAEDTDNKANGDSYSRIKTLLNDKKHKPEYKLPGQVELLSVGEESVRVFVLGPPRDEDDSRLRKTNFGKQEGYHKQKLMNLSSDVDLQLKSIAPYLDPDEVPVSLSPDLEIPFDVAREQDYFAQLYDFGAPNHPEAYRNIDHLAMMGFSELALRMDNYTNNTSLVLAFELPNGNVLLFPGDAQAGNWKSWADLENPLQFKDTDVDAHDLLARTVFYKVGHHGSHNATPKTFGVELMTHPDLVSFIPVDHAIAQRAKYGEMPLQQIVQALNTSGKVYRVDEIQPDAQVRVSEETLSIKIKKEDEPFDRPLYCEIVYSLVK